jgi:hypothetical protein
VSDRRANAASWVADAGTLARARWGYRQMSDLRHKVDSLSAAEKAELLDVVWESLEADAL